MARQDHGPAGGWARLRQGAIGAVLWVLSKVSYVGVVNIADITL